MADLVKGPIVDGPEGAARELKDMLEALQAERDELKQMVLTQADEAAKAARYYADSLEAGRKERTAARARIAQLEAELAGAREALEAISMGSRRRHYIGSRYAGLLSRHIAKQVLAAFKEPRT